MNESEKEIYFLIAKYLKDKFPSVYNSFVREIEDRHLLPNGVFTIQSNFENLDKNALNGILDDQLIRLCSYACNSSQSSSFFFNTCSSSTFKVEDMYLLKNTIPLSPFHNIKINKRVEGHFSSVLRLVVDQTSQLLISGSTDTFIKLWKIPEFTLMSSLSAHKESIKTILVHPTNKMLVSSSLDKTICLFSLIDGMFKQRLPFSWKINTVSLSSCGNYLAAAIDEGFIYVWTINVDKCQTERLILKIANEPKMSITSVRFSPGGNFILYTSEPYCVIIFSLHTNQYYFLEGHKFRPNYAEYCPSDQYTILSFSNKEKNAYLWQSKNNLFDTKITLICGEPKNKQKINKVTWNSDGSRIIGCSNQSLACWDSYDGNLIFMIENEYTDHISVLQVNPTHSFICFIGTQNGKCSIWDINLQKPLSTFSIDVKVTSATFSADGWCLYVGNDEGTIHCFSYQEQYIESQQFLKRELNFNTGDATTIVDRTGTPLEEQPKIFKLSELKLQLKAVKHRGEDLRLIKDWYFAYPMGDLMIVKYIPPKPKPKPIEPVIIDPVEERILFPMISDFAYESESDDTPGMPVPTSMPDWVFSVHEEPETYIPQMGEEIAYFRRGHQALKSECDVVQNLKKPYESRPQMADIAFGIITKTEFALSHLILTIYFIDYGLTSEVVFRLPDSPPFVVARWRLEESLRFASTLSIGQQVEIPYLEDSGVRLYTALIESRSSDIWIYPFESITVGFVDGGDNMAVSPWEIKHDIERAPTPIKELQRKLIPAIQKLSERYEVYKRFRGTDQIELLFVASRRPVDLDLLKDRFENGFYETIDEILNHIDILQCNAELFGLPESENTKVIGELKDIIMSEAQNLGIKRIQIRKEASPRRSPSRSSPFS